MFDWLILRIPGWNRKVRKLRKEWDRAREDALTKKNPLKRMILQKLDLAEDQLKMLEEQPISRVQRKRFVREIEIIIAEVEILLKGKAKDFISPVSAGAKRTKK
jgi:hypothetical protein